MKNILILAVIADVFTDNPDLQAYHETSDGRAFYKANDAKNHAKTLTDKTVKLVERGEESEDNTGTATAKKQEYAADVIAAIEAADTLEALEAYKGDTRTTVVAAFAKKTAELTKTAE